MRIWLLSFLCLLGIAAAGQTDTPALKPVQPNYTARKWTAGAVTALGYGGSFIFLNEAWYKGYERSSFHTFNDAGEWLQMDKLGHAWTAYHTSRVTTSMWKWAGVKPRTAVALGAGTSLAYMLSIEYLDGLSAEWGWSWPDAAADIFGSALFAAQQLAWKDQKIMIKFSSHINDYSPDLKSRTQSLFGKSFPEKLLKDYNAQTYWLSFNLHSLAKLKVPAWLNVAVGYGAEGMLGGYENLAYNKDGTVAFDRRDIPRFRQWYLAPDIDLSRIRTNSPFLKTVLSLFNVLKIPAPALVYANGKFSFQAIAF